MPVTTCRFKPVLWLRIVTAAPGITPPLGSVTAPNTDASCVCDQAVVATKAINAATAFLIMITTSSAVRHLQKHTTGDVALQVMETVRKRGSSTYADVAAFTAFTRSWQRTGLARKPFAPSFRAVSRLASVAFAVTNMIGGPAPLPMRR